MARKPTAVTPRAILLDFYGTVVHEDDVPIAAACDQIAAASPLGVTAREVGAHWSRTFRALCAQSHGPAFALQKVLERRSLQQVGERFQVGLDVDALCQTLYEAWAHPPIFPESQDVLAACPLPVCLVSNADLAELRQALAGHGLDFRWIVSSEECRAYKPHPAMFRRALDLLGLRAAEVLHAGDSIHGDIHGAHALGIPVLWINRTGRSLPEGTPTPDWTAPDLWALLDLAISA
jgi:2-haloalkanoic acid dehalogenase type II